MAEEFDLSSLAVEDALTGHQRAKLEHYGEALFLVLRPARYLDDVEKVEFGEIHVFVGPDFVVTVRHAESPDLARVRRRMEAMPEFLALGPDAVLYAILDQVVDEYEPVAAGLENDIDEIEDDLFGADPDVSRRIYELSRQVITVQRATRPLAGILQALDGRNSGTSCPGPSCRTTSATCWTTSCGSTTGSRPSGRCCRTPSRSTRPSWPSARTTRCARLTESSFAQSEQVKRISSWAAILFAPTLVGTIYGMNFHTMPELDWMFGYPMALGLMVGMGLVLYATFKRNNWI